MTLLRAGQFLSHWWACIWHSSSIIIEIVLMAGIYTKQVCLQFLRDTVVWGSIASNHEDFVG